MSIASYENGGLEAVFTAFIRAKDWDTPLLQGFRHFLVKHIEFDSDPMEGHGALCRALVPDDRKNPVPDMTKSLKDQARLADTVRVSGLLIATMASIAIATGLYASINGSTVSIGRTRDRGLPVRPGEDMRDQQLPAARDGTMADILERLNREDDLVLSRQPETESDRPAIPATAPDVGEAGRRGD